MNMAQRYRLVMMPLIVLFACSAGPAADGIEFDTSRYIDVDELKPGMRGYGLTVFHGTEPERFDVEVVSVTPGGSLLGAKRRAILIKCHDERFDLSKGVQGVSGSPVYFDGRMAGAMSFSWAFSEEPLYGVTPIRHMLETRLTGRIEADSPQINLPVSCYHNLMGDELLSRHQIDAFYARHGHRKAGANRLPLGLMVSGFGAAGIEQLQARMPAAAIHAATGGTQTSETGRTSRLVPGGVMTIPLMTGDLTASLLGTVTEVRGNQIYAFGHQWNGQGRTNWPMAPGYVHTFVSNMQMSFKLGHAFSPVGTIKADEMTAVYGEIGETPPMSPVRVEVAWDYIGHTETFEAEIVRDKEYSPLLAATMLMESLMQRGGLPRRHSIAYELNMEFDGLDPIHAENFTSGGRVGEITGDVLPALMLIVDNPWKDVYLTKMDVKATIMNETRLCYIKSAKIDKPFYQPGEQIRLDAELEADMAPPQHLDIALTLPEDIPEGKYKLELGSYNMLLQMKRVANPMQYRGNNLQDVHRIIQERLATRRDRLYAAMIIPGNGLAFESGVLPELPKSRNQMLMDDTRQMTASPYNRLIYTEVPAAYSLLDKKQFEITVKK